MKISKEADPSLRVNDNYTNISAEQPPMLKREFDSWSGCLALAGRERKGSEKQEAWKFGAGVKGR